MDKSKRSSRQGERPGLLLTALYFLTVYGVLGFTLVVYKTNINPGLPIAVGGVLAVVWLVVRLAIGAGPCYHWGTDLCLGLGLWMAFASFQSCDSYLSSRSLGTFIGAVGFLLATQCTARSSAAWRLLAQGVVGFCSLVSLSAWIPALGKAYATGSLPLLMGPFVNQDTFAIIPMAGLCLGLGLVDRTSRLWRVALLPQLGLLFVSLMATGCRAAMLGFAFGAFLYFGVLLAHRKSHVAKANILLGLPIFLVLLFVPLSMFNVPILAKWTRSAADNGDLENIRFELAKYGWKAAVVSPVWGTGPGTFGLAYQSVRPASRDFHYIDIAHNDILEMAVETGLVGLAFWLTIFGFAVKSLYVHVKDGSRPLEAAGTMAALVSLLMFSLFNFIINERPVLWLQFVVLGLALAFPTSRRVQAERRWVRFSLPILLLPVAVWSIPFGWSTFKADKLAALAAADQGQLRLEDAARALNAAIKIQPHRAELLQKRAAVSAALGAYTSDQRFDEASVVYLQRAHQASPRSVKALNDLAEAYLRMDQVDQAIKALMLAWELAPGEPRVRDRLIGTLARAGRFEDSARFLQPLALGQGQPYVSQLATMIMAVERQQKGKGIALWQALPVEGQPPENLAAIYDALAAQATAKGEWALLIEMETARLKRNPEDICAKFGVALGNGRLSGEDVEYTELSGLISSLELLEDACCRQGVTRWADLGLKKGQGKAVRDRLEGLLKDNSRLVWLRLVLSDVVYADGDKKHAVETIEQGLQLTPYSYDLLMKMGELLEKSGSNDLALGYYREASRVKENDPAANEKINLLLKR